MADLFLGGTIDPATHERTTDDASSHVTVATDKLTTHGVIVGMTGSGKTGLGVIVIEEALKSGLPVIAIDPKGDLTNLCLTFPDLAPADFRPWVDEAQAKNAGQSPDEFAASQAALWTKGLGGWGLGGADIGELRAKTDFSIYTPGSQSGLPVNIVGSLQVPEDMSDAEVVSDEIEGYVSGLLGLVGISADPLSSREHILISNLINHSWTEGRPLDLMTLVGQIATPPIRKLGVFELDQFFPESDRMGLAMKLNGLLASPSFAAWAAGPPLDIQSMMFAADGTPRCAIITTAHLSDEERQFVTALVLAKLVTWMRRQSGTTDLRAMLYMDEVAGYLPPTANPPTKKPIMLLMKQARAFGVGVVLSTQNPVDVDYKALSNAGTWMIGRLQTDRDKARLLDGMSSAAGGVDIGAVGDTISGLGKREFMLRRAGKDTPEVFTTRWAMSYLRGPMTRDQIEAMMAGARGTAAAAAPAAAAPAAAGAAATPAAAAAPAPELADDESAIMPEVADGTPVRYIDVAAPWLADVGGDERGTRAEAAIVARVSVRYDETKADLVHDDEYEAVLFPLDEQVDVSQVVQVDYDDRDLRTAAPDGVVYRLTDAKIANKTFWTQVERDLRDHLTRSLTLSLPANVGLKLYGRPGEDADAFEARCLKFADDKADEEIAALRDKYEKKATSLRNKIEAAEDRIDELEEQTKDKRNSEFLSTAGSVLGGLLGGRKSKGGLLGGMLGKAGTAARRRGTTKASAQRLETAENKMERLVEQVEDLELELEEEVTEIDQKWMELGKEITTLDVGLEKTDVKVSQLVLGWLPVD
ncbi:MAG: ATP-binding protein [Ilumatobacter sp.]|nr:ATP-binding protein [Ilumatobacter sp.]